MSTATDILQRNYTGNMGAISIFQWFNFVEEVVPVGLCMEGREPLDIREEGRYLNTWIKQRGKGYFREGEDHTNAANTIASRKD